MKIIFNNDAGMKNFFMEYAGNICELTLYSDISAR
jgi:hypothetical protein